MKLVRGSWNEDYLQELESFPYGAHDDQVDASAVAFNELAAHSGPRRGWDDVLEIYRESRRADGEGYVRRFGARGDD